MRLGDLHVRDAFLLTDHEQRFCHILSSRGDEEVTSPIEGDFIAGLGGLSTTITVTPRSMTGVRVARCPAVDQRS